MKHFFSRNLTYILLRFASAAFLLLLFFAVSSVIAKAEAKPFPWFLDSVAARDGWDDLSASGEDFSAPIIAAVIDTGCDAAHPLIAGALWENTAEKNGVPGVDDDGNGYIDDIYGIDTCNHDSDPMDDSTGSIKGHGTHVAGVLLQTAGVTENENPFHIRIMPIKAGNAYGDFHASDLAEAIRYAVDNGASVINMSISSAKYPQVLQEAIEYASEYAILVASAGNGALPTLESHYTSCKDYYPAASPLVTGVMSYGKERRLSAFSNWDFSPNTDSEYEIAAPGESISSCTFDAAYKTMSGTSMASGIVSGCAALLCARYRNHGYSARDLTAHLMDSGIPDITYNDLYGNFHTFDGICLPRLLSQEIHPSLVIKNVSTKYDGNSFTLSYTLENRGSAACSLHAKLSCSMPQVSAVCSSPLPMRLDALSQYRGSFLLTLPKDCKEAPLTLQVICEDSNGNCYSFSQNLLADTEASPEPKPDIPLNGISISPLSSLLMKPEDICSLLVTYIPENTTADRTITFFSSDPMTASVDANGTVTAHKEGVADITAVSSAGHIRTIRVTVYECPDNHMPSSQEIPPKDPDEPSTSPAPDKSNTSHKPDKPNTSPADAGHKPQQGEKYTVNHMKYTVTGTGKGRTRSVTLAGTNRKRTGLTYLNIKDTVTICGKSFRVTAVGAGAFRSCTRLRRVKFGKYIKTIQKNAFCGCRRLKTLTVHSLRLCRVGKHAFQGISARAIFRIPARRSRRYRKLLGPDANFAWL